MIKRLFLPCVATCSALTLGLVLSAASAGPLDDAKAQLDGGNIKSAITALRGMLQANPGDTEARTILVQLYLDAGEGAGAQAEIEKALAAGAPRQGLLVALAEALLLQRLWDQVLAISADEAATQKDRAEVQAIRAEATIGLGRMDEARVGLLQALATDPGNTRARLAMAMIAHQDKDLEGARRQIEQAVAADPTAASAWTLLGEFELSERRPAEAESAFTRAIAHSRFQAMSHYQRAVARLDGGNLKGAAEDLDAAEPQLPGFPGIDLARGRLLLNQQQYAPALERLEAALRTEPGNAQGIYLAGVCHLQLGNLAHAEEYLARFHEAIPNDPQGAVALAEVKLKRGDFRAAETLLTPFASGATANAGAIQALARALKGQGRSADAEALMGQFAQANPQAAGARLGLAKAQMGAGKVNEAIDGLQGVLDADPDNLAARRMLTQGHLGARDPAAALAEAMDLWFRAPDDPQVLDLLGLALLANRDQAGARLAFNQALALKPDAVAPALRLAALEGLAKRPEAARALYERVLACHPGQTQALRGLASLDAKGSGGPKAAQERLIQALAKAPENLELRVALAKGQMSDGDAALALQTLQQAPATQAGRSELLLARGQAELAAKQPSAAVASFQKVLEQQPDSAVAQYYLAGLYADQGDRSRMREHLGAGLRANPKLPMADKAIAAALRATPDGAEQVSLLDDIAGAAPDHPSILLMQGQIALAAGDGARALERFTALRQVAPRDPAGVRGEIAARVMMGKPAEAVTAGRDWLAENPQDMETGSALAGAYLRLNEPRAASALYAKVIAARPDDWVALNNQANLIQSSDLAGALGLAERAYALRPGDPSVADTLSTILLAAAPRDPRGALSHAEKLYAVRADPNLALALAQLLGLAGQEGRARTILTEAHNNAPENPQITYRYAEAMAGAGQTALARSALKEIVEQSFPGQAQARALLKRLKD